MISFQRQQRLDPSNCTAWRGIRIFLILATLALAGCANTHTNNKETAYIDGSDGYDAEWAADQDDPIGMLLANNLRRAPRKSSSATASAGQGLPTLASEALSYLGVRYRYGGDSPSTGFDCSGLVSYAASQSLGMKLPRSAAEIAQFGASVDREALSPGDLVFFNTMGRRYSHVGIYLGEDRFVHSPSAGGRVRIERLSMTYWDKRYNGARRLDRSLQASAALR
jgi:cell wall-associated NlpC family hydrolase